MVRQQIVFHPNCRRGRGAVVLRQRGRPCNLRSIHLRKLVMPDTRNHRGPDTLDRQRFGTDAISTLRLAASDLSWLFTRGYASPSSLKLVGDRYRLDARQRQAVARCTAATADVEHRIAHRVPDLMLAGESIWIDGFNVRSRTGPTRRQSCLLWRSVFRFPRRPQTAETVSWPGSAW